MRTERPAAPGTPWRRRRRRTVEDWLGALAGAALLVIAGVGGLVVLALVVYAGWAHGGLTGALAGLGLCLAAVGAVVGVAWWLLSAEERSRMRR